MTSINITRNIHWRKDFQLKKKKKNAANFKWVSGMTRRTLKLWKFQETQNKLLNCSYQRLSSVTTGRRRWRFFVAGVIVFPKRSFWWTQKVVNAISIKCNQDGINNCMFNLKTFFFENLNFENSFFPFERNAFLIFKHFKLAIKMEAHLMPYILCLSIVRIN